MLPLPRHLLKIDPEDVVREIEDDSLSQFLWSLRPRLTRKMRGMMAMSSPLALTTNKEIKVNECCAQ